MKALSVLFFLSLLKVTTVAQTNIHFGTLNEKYIYLIQQNTKRTKINIGFINHSDSSKSITTKKVFKTNKFKYIKLENELYYLNADVPPIFSTTVCDELKKIEPDTSVKFCEPITKSIIVALMINSGHINFLGTTVKFG